jgi:hypothetical protein
VQARVISDTGRSFRLIIRPEDFIDRSGINRFAFLDLANPA